METAAQQKRLIDDAGETIAGARKDWKARALSVDDLVSMTAEEVVIETKKDNVWPKPDWEAAVAGGMAPEAAAYAKIVRDRMAQEPRKRAGGGALDLRRAFVEMTAKVRDVYMGCRTAQDARAAYSRIRSEFGRLSTVGEESLKFGSVYKSRACPFYVSPSDDMRVAQMIAEGFPGKVAAWRKGVLVRRMTDGTIRLVKGPLILKDGFASEAEAFGWLEGHHRAAAKEPKKGETKAEPVRPHLDRLRREGLPDTPRDGRDVSPDEFIEKFGFRGVQFGNWLPDGERQTVLNMGYDAICDLAEVLGWEPEAMSLGGTLSVAFGARGKGGRAAAHYEAGQRIVNMTRISGAGSLAHEFGHALDHWAGTGGRQTDGVPSGSGWYGAPNLRRETLAHRGEEISAAWAAAMTSIVTAPVRREARIEAIENNMALMEEKLRLNEQGIARQMAMEEPRRNRKYLKEAAAWSKAQTLRIEGLREKASHLRAMSDDSFHGTAQSSFLSEAVSISGSGEYWKRPTELFARAFESWAFDSLSARGGLSEYLVHGVEEGRYSGPEFKGDPYPSGGERERINAAMAALAAAMKTAAELNASPAAGPR